MVQRHGGGDVLEAAPALLSRALPKLGELGREVAQLLP